MVEGTRLGGFDSDWTGSVDGSVEIEVDWTGSVDGSVEIEVEGLVVASSAAMGCIEVDGLEVCSSGPIRKSNMVPFKKQWSGVDGWMALDTLEHWES